MTLQTAKEKLLTIPFVAGALSLGTSLFAFAEEAAADAETAAEAAEEGTEQVSWLASHSWVIWIAYIAFFALIFYFLMIRPSKKQREEEEKRRKSLTLGSEIITKGGICGKVVNIKDDIITIETSVDRTLIEFVNTAIAEIRTQAEDNNEGKS